MTSDPSSTENQKLIKFQYFTYFLNSTRQTLLFPENRSKKDIITDILQKSSVEYKNRGVDSALVFIKKEGNYFFAKLGKKASLKRILPPKDKFEEKLEESWPHCNVVFNIDENPKTGQRIAFEFKPYIFPSPYSQLKSLADEFNAMLLPTGYTISINPITVEQDFWNIVRDNTDRIEKMSFTLNAPNLFNLDNSLSDELKYLQKDYSMTKVTMGLENPSGKLKIPQNKLTKEAVEYISRGGGEYKLKIKGKGNYVISSRKNIKTKTFDSFDFDFKTRDQKLISDILKRIFQ